VLTTLNHMADEGTEERYRLLPGMHYWRAGDSIYLVMGSCMQRYKLYSRAMGETVIIGAFDQLRNLITGEVYFERTEQHPTRQGTEVFVLNASKLAKRGTEMTNFRESEMEET
jgi:hypothetical protein